jgi:GNAT superfamily N-acetyltransferase
MPPGATHYVERPRSYTSALVLVGVLAVGFVLDLGLGGASSHLWGWLIALVLVLGADLLVIYAARSTRTIRLTDDALVVGDDALPREHIEGIADEVAYGPRVLGLMLTRELPKNTPGLALRLHDASVVIVPTRKPEQLAGALGLRAVEDPVRPATDADLPLLQEIDDRADTIFRIAGYDLPDVSLPGRPAVAVFVVGTPPYGYARVGLMDGTAYLDDLAVLPGRMRRGVGRRLVDAACAWARDHGHAAITLVTYADVPWNGPFYARLGFAVVDETGPEMSAYRAAEREAGLDAVGRRVVMRKPLTGPR